jgi:DNA-binding winged helix-turn-helix (wHTH) protein/Tfp pilus assembly protein PilF
VKVEPPSDRSSPAGYEFGGFRLDLRRRMLFAPGGRRVALTPRVLDTLVCLVQHPGVLLTRDMLMDSIWPDAAVEPNNLSQGVAKLRREFREQPGDNRFIETVPGRGYRFIAAVRIEARMTGAGPEATPDSSPLYRQALRLLQRPTSENCARAAAQLHAVLAQDPECGPAWAWLADAHLLRFNIGFGSAPDLDDAECHAAHALQLDPRLATAHAIFGTVCAHRGDWLASESHFMTAVSLDQSDAMARTLHASFLLQQVGHTRRALAQLREAFALAPDDPRMLMNLAMSHCIAGDDAEAVRCAHLAIGLGYPEQVLPLPFVFMHVAARAGRHAEAAAHARHLFAGTLQEGAATAGIVHAALQSGRESELIPAAHSVLHLLNTKSEQLTRANGLILLALQWLTQLGRTDLALEAGQKALDSFSHRMEYPRFWQTLWIPELLPFRRDERFAPLAARLRLPEYWSAFGRPD